MPNSNLEYVKVPGSVTHELPPLLVSGISEGARRDDLLSRAAQIIESEDMIADADPGIIDERKLDLALNLTDQYFGLLQHWAWGDSVFEWIRQCETTFEVSRELRNILRADVWPHASRSSFVTLLQDKGVRCDGVDLEKAVGLRLTFRRDTYVPGARVSGHLNLDATLALRPGRLRVAGVAGGFLAIRANGSVNGRLGGRRVRLRLSVQ